MNKHTSQRASTACKQHTGFPEDLTTWRCLVGLSMWMCACTSIHTYLFECVIFDLWNAGASIAKQYRWQSLEAINNQIRSGKQQCNQKQMENITRPDDKETHIFTTRQISLPLLRRRCCCCHFYCHCCSLLPYDYYCNYYCYSTYYHCRLSHGWNDEKDRAPSKQSESLNIPEHRQPLINNRSAKSTGKPPLTQTTSNMKTQKRCKQQSTIPDATMSNQNQGTKREYLTT